MFQLAIHSILFVGDCCALDPILLRYNLHSHAEDCQVIMVSEGSYSVVITGGRSLLAAQLVANIRLDETLSCVCTRFDKRAPLDSAGGVFVQGSVNDVESLQSVCIDSNASILVHLAGWQQFHFDVGERCRRDFFNVNIQGTLNVLEVLPKTQVKSVLYISNTSINDDHSVSGWTAKTCETMFRHYASINDIDVVILRMPQYIPYFDTEQFQGNFSKWAQQFWNKEGIHLEDAANCCISCIKHFIKFQGRSKVASCTQISRSPVVLHPGCHWEDENEEQSRDFLRQCREISDVETLQKLVFDRYGGEFVNTIKKFQLSLQEIKGWNPKEKENILNGWKPKYSKAQVVYDLMKFGHEGTGIPMWAANPYPGSFVNDDGVYVEGGM